MNRIIIFLLLATLSFGQYTVNLEQKTVTRPGVTPYEEVLHYFKVSFNTDNNKVDTLFDTTSTESWRVVPTSAGALPLSSVNGGISSATASEVTNVVSLGDDKFKGVSFLEGAVTPNELTKVVGAGLGLGLGNKDFQKNVAKSQQLQSQAFSFYYNGNQISQIQFGNPEGYFASEPPTSFNVQPNTGTQGYWQLYLTNFGIDQQQNSVNVIAQIDTTTEYIWVGAAQYNWVKTTLTNYYGIQFSNGDQCTCVPVKKPQIYLQFSNGPTAPKNANTEAKFKLSYDDFIHKNSNGQCSLAFRQLTGASTTVILGNSFLKGVYVWFNAVNEGQSTVKMATAFKVPVQPLSLNENWRIAFIVTGMLIIFFSVFILLAMLRKVPYDPSRVAPVQLIQQPVQLTHSQIQLQQYQPTRVIIQPQQQYVQPQQFQQVVYRQ